MTKKVKFVKVNKNRFERVDQEKVRKVYQEQVRHFPSGGRMCYLIWDETLNRVRWVKADHCTLIEEKEIEVA